MQQPWGFSFGMDLKNCNDSIKRKEDIQDYVIKLCKRIDMKRFGDCQIVNFGSGNKEGYSMVQLIETSCITAHFANESNSAYIDIFSCKEFNPEEVALFTMEFFGSIEINTHWSIRN